MAVLAIGGERPEVDLHAGPHVPEACQIEGVVDRLDLIEWTAFEVLVGDL